MPISVRGTITACIGAGLLIHKLAEEFYKDYGLEGNVYFSDSIFEGCLVDILVDIARLKHFHDISRVNYIKFIAYTASWCLKRKPFQLLLQACGCSDDNMGYYEADQKSLMDAIGQM